MSLSFATSMEAELLDVPKEGLPQQELELAQWAVSNLCKHPAGPTAVPGPPSPPHSLYGPNETENAASNFHEPMDHSQQLPTAMTLMPIAAPPSDSPIDPAELGKNFPVHELLDDEQQHPAEWPLVYSPGSSSDDLLDAFAMEETFTCPRAPIGQKPASSILGRYSGGTALDQEQSSMSAGLSSSKLLLNASWPGPLPDVPEGLESVDNLTRHIPMWSTREYHSERTLEAA